MAADNPAATATRNNAGIYFFGTPPGSKAIVALAPDVASAVTQTDGIVQINLLWSDVSLQISMDPNWNRENELRSIRGWLARFPERDRDAPGTISFLEKLDKTVAFFGAQIEPCYDFEGKVARLLKALLIDTGGFLFSHQSFYSARGHRIVGLPGDPVELGPAVATRIDDRPPIIRLYRRDAEGLRYHEAWEASGKIIEHWGAVGTRGQYRVRSIVRGWTKQEAMEHILRKSRDSGFAPLEEDAFTSLVIEYRMAGGDGHDDLVKRRDLEHRMHETLGWTGLGHCEGSGVDSKTLQIRCRVVDFRLAKRVIEADLQHTAFSDHSRIFEPSSGKSRLVE